MRMNHVSGRNARCLRHLAMGMRALVVSGLVVGCAPPEADEDETPEMELPVSGVESRIQTSKGSLAATAAFVHPGVLVSQKQLNFLKSKIDAEPWKTALKSARASRFGSLTYQPHPVAIAGMPSMMPSSAAATVPE